MVNAAQSIPTTEEIFNRAEALFADIALLPFDFAADVAVVIESAASDVPYKRQTKEGMLEALNDLQQQEQLRQICGELSPEDLEKALEIAQEINARRNTLGKEVANG